MTKKYGTPKLAVSLVLMEKNGERLEVHPTTVLAHEAVGWTVVGADVTVEQVPEYLIADELPAEDAPEDEDK